MPVSERFYLADAVFVAGLEGDPQLVDTLHAAVRRPHYLPYLGRRSCPPARPLDLGVRSGSLLDALRKEPWHASDWHQRRRCDDPLATLTVLVDTTPDDPAANALRDVPLTFDPRHRRYALRSVGTAAVTVANPHVPQHARIPDHDPTSLLSPLDGP
jgi:CRISPR system Cascade subunit CasD